MNLSIWYAFYIRENFSNIRTDLVKKNYCGSKSEKVDLKLHGLPQIFFNLKQASAFFQKILGKNWVWDQCFEQNQTHTPKKPIPFDTHPGWCGISVLSTEPRTHYEDHPPGIPSRWPPGWGGRRTGSPPWRGEVRCAPSAAGLIRLPRRPWDSTYAIDRFILP